MDKIQWLGWSPEVFERARKEDKLVLLYLGARWCHWCHVMDLETYSNPEIIKIVHEEYLPIRVDSDVRPDINERYNQGGWPSTVILTAEGFVVHGATYLPFEAVKELLEQAKEWYRENRQRLADAAQEMARKMVREPAQPPRAHKDPKDFSPPIVRDIKQNADPIHGGFGTSEKFPEAGAISLAIASHYTTGDQSLLDFAEKTLTNMSEGLLDSEEGGLFRYSVTPEWSQPHYEKTLDVNAECLQNYLDAYRVTGKREYATTAEKIIQYVQNALSDRKRGGFYGSQDADIFDDKQMKIVMEGEKYYKLSSQERRKHGFPSIDKTIYTNCNALMISSFLEAYHVLQREDCRDFALMTLQLLMDQCFDRNTGASHYLNDGKAEGSGLLTDNVALSRANLDAYETTGRREHLGDAELLMKFVADHLSAPDGGFFDSRIDENMPPAMRIRHKPLRENAWAVEVLAKLYNYTANSHYYELAESTLSAFQQDIKTLLERGMGYFASEIALAALYASDASTKIAVVGSKDDQHALDLLMEAHRIYRPVKMVQFLDPAEDMHLIQAMNYGPAGSPVAHVCTEKGCAAPINVIEQLREALDSR